MFASCRIDLGCGQGVKLAEICWLIQVGASETATEFNTLNTVMQSLTALADPAFVDDPGNPLSATHALVVAQHGNIVLERYAPGHDHESTFISWSMAKSMLSVLVGMLVGDGLLDIDEPAPVAGWQGADDPRKNITLRHLLSMRSGLAWVEDYVDDQASDVIDMLFGPGQHDVAAWAIAKPLAAAPGESWLYSSGTSNIIAKIVGDALGGPQAVETALADRLFGPLGMTSAIPKFDQAGTWIASSFVYATARDFLAFGEFMRNDGIVDGRRLLPEGWIDRSTRAHVIDPDSGQGYGFHWWTVEQPPRSFSANGYEGQRIEVVPELGLSFVRLGKTTADFSDDLRSFYRSIVTCFA